MSLGALVAAVALLGVNAFFVAAEFALLAARRSRIEQLAAEGDARARHASAALRELSLMLAGAQLGITMASFGLGAVAEPAVAAGFEAVLDGVGVPSALTHTIAFTLALALVVFLHMVVGEMAPKSWAITHPEMSALRLVRPFRAFALLFRPFLRLLNALANASVRAVGVTPQDELAQVHAPTDLLLLLEESAETGALGADQHVLLARALDLSELDAQAAMVPRRDVVAVPADADVDAIEAVARTTGRSRLPVYDGDIDRISGVVHVRDLLGVEPHDRATTTAAALSRPAVVVPESKPLEDCMVDMRQARQHVAIVVDEYGSVSGIVTLEDVLEELIGEFEDESDRARVPRRRADGALLVPGALRPDELAERTDVALPEGDWETVAGYVIALLGRLPRRGDVVEDGRARFEVARMDGHRVVELAVRPNDDHRTR